MGLSFDRPRTPESSSANRSCTDDDKGDTVCLNKSQCDTEIDTRLCPTQLYSHIYPKPERHLIMSLKLCDQQKSGIKDSYCPVLDQGLGLGFQYSQSQSQASFLSPHLPPMTAPPSSSMPPPLTFYTLPRSLYGRASLTHLIPHQLPTSTEGRFQGHHPWPRRPDLLPSLWAPSSVLG